MVKAARLAKCAVRQKKVSAKKNNSNNGAVSAALCFICREVEIVRSNNGGNLPYGALQKVVKEHKVTFPWLNVMQVKNYIRRLKKTIPIDVVQLPSDPVSTSTTSALTIDPLLATSTLEATESTYEDYATESVTELDAIKSTTELDVTESMDMTNYVAPNAIGGRPKGSTSAHSRELRDRIKLVLEEAAAEYMIERSNGKNTVVSSKTRVTYNDC